MKIVSEAHNYMYFAVIFTWPPELSWHSVFLSPRKQREIPLNSDKTDLPSIALTDWSFYY